jgi:putative acetyltransferase
VNWCSSKQVTWVALHDLAFWGVVISADKIVVELVPIATGDVRALIGELDRPHSAEYLREQRHGLALHAIFKPNIRFFSARLNDVAVGCGGMAFFAGFAEVKRMYVRDGARGRGVAQALLTRIEDEARDAGFGLLRLETGERQIAALRFYERAGFLPCAAFGAYATMAPHTVATSVFLQKQLTEPNKRSPRYLVSGEVSKRRVEN